MLVIITLSSIVGRPDPFQAGDLRSSVQCNPVPLFEHTQSRIAGAVRCFSQRAVAKHAALCPLEQPRRHCSTGSSSSGRLVAQLCNSSQAVCAEHMSLQLIPSQAMCAQHQPHLLRVAGQSQRAQCWPWHVRPAVPAVLLPADCTALHRTQSQPAHV